MHKKLTSLALAIVLSGSLSTAAFASSGTVEHTVNFRSAPSTGSTVYSSLKPGTSVNVLEQLNRYWLKIEVNGKVGYASTRYIAYKAEPAPSATPAPMPAPTTAPKPTAPPAPVQKPTPVNANADQVIAHALALQGVTHYKYGVNNPTSLMDCSAFTKYVFGKVGISLKWGTRYQKDAGSYVPRDSLQKGDLVFFSIGSSTSIGHVGIYIGDGKMIHNSPSQNGVGISSLTSGYWDKHYVTARRVIQ